MLSSKKYEQFRIRKQHFSTIVDKMYVIKNIEHTKDKRWKSMKIEILLKQIRKEKRNKPTTTFKINWHFVITFKLYRKERKRPVFIYDCKDCSSIKYKNRGIIQSNTIVLLFNFVNEKCCFVKFPPQWTRFNIFSVQKILKSKK